MSSTIYMAMVLLFSRSVSSDNSTDPVGSSDSSDTCALQPAEGPWSAALEDWVTAERVTVGRHGRIMALPSTQGYYVSDRIDLVPPPPPSHYPPGTHGTYSTHGTHGTQHMLHRGPYPAHHGPPDMRPQNQPPNKFPGSPESPNMRLQNQPPQSAPPSGPPLQVAQGAPQGSMPYDEWQVTPPPPPGAGKIVNRPPNPYKDQFKPSYPVPPPQSIPVQPTVDRVDEARPPPHKQVSETDLYLLGAIEKLVYRVDLMEKRLRKMEENVHYLVAGAEPKPEPCPSNFTRVGSGCYHVSTEALNWKNANYACRKVKGYLLELDGDERRTFTSGLLANNNFKGYDYWSGGLNPGLLWIWSHSAQAIANTTTSGSGATIVGDGRCLALVHDAATTAYVYRGQDCALRHRYVCERDEDKTKLGNEIERVARQMRQMKRMPKMKWTEDLA